MTSRSFHRISFIRRLLPLSKVITRDIMTSIKLLEDGEPSVGEMGRGILCAMVGSIRLWLSLWGYVAVSSAKGGDGETESD
jgi:hypothetical protein